MSFSTPLALLLLPIVAAFAIWAWMGRNHGLGKRRRWTALAIRLLLFAAVILSLAGATWQRPRTQQAVAFVGDISASTYAGRDAIVGFINQALHARQQGDQAAIVATGQESVVEQPPSAVEGLARFESVIDPNFTNLESGIGLGAALLPANYRRRVVLLSDGRENVGDAASEAALLRSEGIRVDVVPVAVTPGPDARVDAVDVPANLHLGERFPLTASITSSVATTAAIQVFQDGQVAHTGTLTLQQGSSSVTYTLNARQPGLHTYRVVIQPAIDTLSQNNEASAYAMVSGPPDVLVVEGYPGAGHNVVADLRAAHMNVTIEPGYGVSADPAILQRYAGMVLVDVPADELGQPVMNTLQSYVRDLGHGLVVIGGVNSYSLGNYASTPLEATLPVRMDLPKRKDLPTAAVVLIIESLESESSVNVSKQAGKGVVGLLNPQDLVAVSDATSSMIVPLQHPTNKARIDAAIDGMVPDDPGSYQPYLQQAYDMLKGAKAQTKHIILLGDGDAYDNYQPLLARIAAAHIQVSTIETNAQVAGDFKTMHDIAGWGGGKEYPADNVNSIPRVFLKVARDVAHSSILENPFFPVQVGASPIVNGLSSVPELRGYAITTPKSSATVVLASDKNDPVLAQWQYGLGRTVAWTSDSQGRWSAAWLASPGTRRIWSSMIQWVLPPPQSADLSLSTRTSGGTATIAVDSNGSDSYRSIVAHVLGPQGPSTLTLEATTPGHYEAQLPAAGEGAYLIDVQASRADNRQMRTVRGGLVIGYSPEYRDVGLDRGALQAIATAGGGTVLRRPSEAFADDLPPVTAPTSLQLPLLLLALILLPIDVAVRRLTLERRDLAALFARKQRAHVAIEDASAPLAALRARRTMRAMPARPDAQQPLQPKVQTGDRLRGYPAQSGTGEAIGVPARPARLGQNEAASATKPASPPSGAPIAAEGSESAASKLLEAKRRRRSS